MSDLGLALEVLRTEGALAVRDRLIDRVAESVRRLRFRPLDLGAAQRLLEPFRPAVLNLSPVPPAPARGGAQAQMLDRLAVESRSRPLALAYPRGDRLVLEVHRGRHRGLLSRAVDGSVSESVVELAASLGAEIVHLENPSGLPLEVVPQLAAAGFTTIVSVHDFSYFCRRPHLIDSATGDFCDYSRDNDRCRACLAGDGIDHGADQTEYRRRGLAALQTAHRVIYPSEFLRRQYAELFPSGRDHERSAVIPPATCSLPYRRRPDLDAPVVAFVGGACRHKGGHLFRETAERVRQDLPNARFVCFGNGEPGILADMRRSRLVEVRGYYRRSTLPRLLGEAGARAAVFASIWPETYGMTVDECLRAGVPVVAFDHGAVGDRARNLAGLHVVDLARGPEDLASAAREILTGARCGVDAATAERLPTPGQAAERMRELYRRAETSANGDVGRVESARAPAAVATARTSEPRDLQP